MPLIRCKAVESRSFGINLHNAAPTNIVAISNYKLPEAAARRLALPSQRKPSRCILGNTMAIQVEAAEYALAVRAAQRYPGRSQLKPSLHDLGHAWSAVNQHIRQVRVRGPVLQQRRPPPALRRLAEALLPVKPPPLLEQSFALCRWRGRGLTSSAAGSTTSAEPRDIRVKKAELGVLGLQQKVFRLQHSAFGLSNNIFGLQLIVLRLDVDRSTSSLIFNSAASCAFSAASSATRAFACSSSSPSTCARSTP
jgi:hypothetical protein